MLSFLFALGARLQGLTLFSLMLAGGSSPALGQSALNPSAISPPLQTSMAAPSNPQLGLSQSEALQLALQLAPALQAAQWDLEAARLAAQPAGAWPNPKLAFGVENFPVSGADRWRLNSDGMTMRRVALMQDLPNADKRAAQVARAEAQIQRRDVEQRLTALMVQREVASAWIRRYTVEQQQLALAQLGQELDRWRQITRAQVLDSRSKASDLLMPEQEKLMWAERSDMLRAQHQQAVASLQRWIGPAAARPLQGEPQAWTDSAEHLHQALDQHPELQVVDAMAAAMRAEVQETLAMKKPDWSVELAFQQRSRAFGNMVSLQLSMDLPLFNRERVDPLVAARQAEQARLRQERDSMRREHQEILASDLAELERLQRGLARLQQDNQHWVDEKIRLSRSAYQTGQGTLAEVLAAQREAVELKLKQIAWAGDLALLRTKLHFSREPEAHRPTVPTPALGEKQ